MITAVDTSVLLDVFLPDQEHGERSMARLREAYDDGAIAICEVVYAELAAAFPDRATLDRGLREVNAVASSIDASIAYEAGLRWRRYRQAGGPRKTDHHRFPHRSPRRCCCRPIPHQGPGVLRDLFPRVVGVGRLTRRLVRADQ